MAEVAVKSLATMPDAGHGHIFSPITGGVFKLTLTNVLNVFGRPEGYLLSIIFPTIGLVMTAGCNGVKAYAAAQVFYWAGFPQRAQLLIRLWRLCIVAPAVTLPLFGLFMHYYYKAKHIGLVPAGIALFYSYQKEQ
ncbi:hypothetical protein Neosp_008276 [[Neocosmospora] mangrovei]